MSEESEEKGNPSDTSGVRDKLPDPRDDPVSALERLGRMHRGYPLTGQPKKGIDFESEDHPTHPTTK